MTSDLFGSSNSRSSHQKREQWAKIHSQQTRERAESSATDSTEVPGGEEDEGGAAPSSTMVFSEDVLTQSFDKEVEIGGIRFDTVKLFHPRKGEPLLLVSLRVGGSC